MTNKELIDYLETQGYKSYSVPYFESKDVVWVGSKRLPEGSSLCDTNKIKISWHVKVWHLKLEGDAYNREMKSVEISITAEKHGQWVDLKCYGVPWNDLKDQLPVAERCLLNAWEGLQ